MMRSKCPPFLFENPVVYVKNGSFIEVAKIHFLKIPLQKTGVKISKPVMLKTHKPEELRKTGNVKTHKPEGLRKTRSVKTHKPEGLRKTGSVKTHKPEVLKPKTESV